METLRYSQIGRQDLRVGRGQFEVTLGDGRVVTMDEILLPEYAEDAGSTDSYAITVANVTNPYQTGMVYYFKANTANTGAATLNINSAGAKTIKKNSTADLATGDIVASQMVAVIYDGTNFQLLSHVPSSDYQSGSQLYAADAGSSDAYVLTLSPVPAAYTTGMVIHFKANTKNTGASTLNVNSLGAKNIYKNVDQNLENDDIQASQIVSVVYDGTNFQLLSFPSTTVAQTGSQLYAADAGSSDAYAMTLDPVPAAYTTGMVLHFKANTANSGPAALNVNSLGAKTIKKYYNSDLEDGDIQASQIISVVYDGTNFQAITPMPSPAGGESEWYYSKQVYQLLKDPGRATITGAPSTFADSITADVAASADTTDGPWVKVDTTAASGNDAIIQQDASGANITGFRSDWQPIFVATIKTSTNIADVRIWCGWASADPSASATPAVHLAAFRYDTGADGTAFWRCVTDNASGSPTVTATTVPVSTSTAYTMRIAMSNATPDVKFYLDNVLVATHTLTLPTSTTVLLCWLSISALAAAVKALLFRRFVVTH